jgi:LPS-assembly protein
MDGKLIFERDASWLGERALQTLEPRLYYLYTPYVDQDDTPVFDSSELTFNFSNLFRSNRFTGRDRIGDANQLTAALTSRTLRAATGEELFRLSLGQIFYFADRRVQISGPRRPIRSPPIPASSRRHCSSTGSAEPASSGTRNWKRSNGNGAPCSWNTATPTTGC